MAYIIVTESTCDLSLSFRESHEDLLVIPLTYYLNGKEYADDGKGLSNKEFYDILRKNGEVSTGQVGIYTFQKAVRPYLEKGMDLLYIGMSSGLSGSYQSAICGMEELKNEYPERRFEAIDSRSASMGQGLLVVLALEAKAAGKSFEEVSAMSRANRDRLCTWLTVDDLMFVKRGGRLNASTAILGTALGIKPIMHTDERGKLEPKEKVRGRMASLKALADKIGSLKEEDAVALCHGDCLEDAQKLERLIREKYRFSGRILMETIGTVVGAHGGPGAMAVFFMGENH
ncbi:MAG: DegV family protein [Clostridia bacterium]|nr:DegV family protein [Clostridia bacterium]